MYTVVGVIPHLKTIQLANDDVELFFPAAQARPPASLVVRASGNLTSVVQSIRAEVSAVDPRVSIQQIGMVDGLFAEFDPLGPPRFYAVLLGMLAGLRLLTAAVGLYGLLSYAVSQRTREIGVRMALGADVGSVRRLVVRDGLWPVAIGMAAGLVTAMWLSKFLVSPLFHVAPHDPTMFIAIVALFVTVCGLAIIAPVRRATRIDAVDALRAD